MGTSQNTAFLNLQPETKRQIRFLIYFSDKNKAKTKYYHLLPPASCGALLSFVTVFFNLAPLWIEVNSAPRPAPPPPPPDFFTPAGAVTFGGGGADGGGGGGGGIV